MFAAVATVNGWTMEFSSLLGGLREGFAMGVVGKMKNGTAVAELASLVCACVIVVGAVLVRYCNGGYVFAAAMVVATLVRCAKVELAPALQWKWWWWCCVFNGCGGNVKMNSRWWWQRRDDARLRGWKVGRNADLCHSDVGVAFAFPLLFHCYNCFGVMVRSRCFHGGVLMVFWTLLLLQAQWWWFSCCKFEMQVACSWWFDGVWCCGGCALYRRWRSGGCRQWWNVNCHGWCARKLRGGCKFFFYFKYWIYGFDLSTTEAEKRSMTSGNDRGQKGVSFGLTLICLGS